jgi:DNA ligase (NAD+)
LSLNLEYDSGQLMRGLLRGDGISGEEKTENIRNSYYGGRISSLFEDFTGSVRCEGVVFNEDFEQFTGESNPRNSAVGAIRKTDSPRARWVRVICYDIVNGHEFKTEVEKLQFMERIGLPTAQYHVFSSPDEVIAFYESVSTGRADLPYMIDGLVLKINDLAQQKELGSHNGNPRGQVAFKFATKTGTTVVRKIIETVGHTGQIIPTAEYDPVVIDGREFRHALLDNYDFIERIGLNVSDTVCIGIMGDIIPKILTVESKGSNGAYQRPQKCPVCGSSTEIDGAYTRCTNKLGCSGQVIGKINNWIKKVDIKYLGQSRQKALFEAGVLHSVGDIYRMTEQSLGAVIGYGNADIVLEQIESHRDIPLHLFMGSLGVQFLGRSNAKKLIDAGFDSLDKFLDTQSLRDANIHGFKNNLMAIADGIDAVKPVIDDLLDAGVTIQDINTMEASMNTENTALAGKTFCFTGVRLHDDVQEQFESMGGVEKSSVSKGLDYLVAKDPSKNTGKMKKARELGVKVISYDEFLDQLA